MAVAHPTIPPPMMAIAYEFEPMRFQILTDSLGGGNEFYKEEYRRASRFTIGSRHVIIFCGEQGMKAYTGRAQP
jgi:hypothetical protein